MSTSPALNFLKASNLWKYNMKKSHRSLKRTIMPTPCQFYEYQHKRMLLKHLQSNARKMSCNSAVILPKSRTCNAKLSRTCNWVKFPWSSSTFNPSSPKMILSLWADVLVCRNIRQCSLNVLLHSAARNQVTTRQYKVLSLFRLLPAISAPPPPKKKHSSSLNEGRTNRKWYNLIHICKYRRTTNWEASVITVSADRKLYTLSKCKIGICLFRFILCACVQKTLIWLIDS